ncbi:hypothetical protein B0H17DRAFT_933580, partial [Mycena rosella]
MTSNPPSVPLLPDGEKFDGTRFPGWQTQIYALAKACGVAAYLDGTLPEPPTPAGNTPQTTSLPPDPTPSREEWTYRDAQAYALVVLNVKNPVGLGMKLDG